MRGGEWSDFQWTVAERRDPTNKYVEIVPTRDSGWWTAVGVGALSVVLLTILIWTSCVEISRILINKDQALQDGWNAIHQMLSAEP